VLSDLSDTVSRRSSVMVTPLDDYRAGLRWAIPVRSTPVRSRSLIVCRRDWPKGRQGSSVKKKHKKVLNKILLGVSGVAALGVLGDPHWPTKLVCVSVLLLALAVELGFAVDAECRVFRSGMKHPCTRRTYGVLLGCHSHRLLKLLVWLRFLGAGRLLERLGVSRAVIASDVYAMQQYRPLVSVGAGSLTQFSAGAVAPTEKSGRENIEFACLLISTIASVVAAITPFFLA
jgi:hypothetical protein